MRINDLFNSFIVLAAFSISACDGVDDPEASDRMLVGDLEDANDADDDDIDDLSAADEQADRDDLTAKPTPEDGSPALLELPLADETNPVAGPPGTVCCADCGGDYVGWYNLGNGDNCNSRAWDFCVSTLGTSLINAEWGYCY